MSEKERGLYQKYEVKKLSNPDKPMDCIVLEFDDPVARIAIATFAQAMIVHGYALAGLEIFAKLETTEAKR